ncbi:hypothetical protein CXG81DRAFT_28375 [Caulochytrium protostelioides]|uniref:Uncharacterized protein n=1 Tax=Caulochytrium protostelioides TaxID=1555241 RepID=A0A4P9WZA9_9FUNG|nr:hypothetical protein CXG81DRAFT_28375 [Caulochytrium protostelioides]|eukprot:RKO98834.1 hypothetical protein CXG81DRAFT_28375 [Caulochytrium protostelioides]
MTPAPPRAASPGPSRTSSVAGVDGVAAASAVFRAQSRAIDEVRHGVKAIRGVLAALDASAGPCGEADAAAAAAPASPSALPRDDDDAAAGLRPATYTLGDLVTIQDRLQQMVTLLQAQHLGPVALATACDVAALETALDAPAAPIPDDPAATPAPLLPTTGLEYDSLQADLATAADELRSQLQSYQSALF